MDYTKSQKKYYCQEENDGQQGLNLATFERDITLPSLPVPSLQESIAKYLKSIQPFVDQDEYQRSENICADFLNQEISSKLQNELLQRAKDKINWLDEWWLEKGYLQYRGPLIPFLNTAGPFAATNPGGAWHAMTNEKPMERIALFVFHLLQFWKLLREQRLKPDVSKQGKYFSMDQFRRLFGTTRIPHTGQDKLRITWKTKAEGGQVPTHIVVMRNGYFFQVDFLNDQGEPYPPPILQNTLTAIKLEADELLPGYGIGALTRGIREEWAKNRLKLIELGNENQLEIIETAMFIVVLDESKPKNDSEVSWSLMVGSPQNRWADKSYTVVMFDNGTGGVNSDHTPFDAMVNVVTSHFIDLGILDTNGIWPTPTDDDTGIGNAAVSSTLMFQRLSWRIDEYLHAQIEDTKSSATQTGNQILLKRTYFSEFGKNGLIQLKVNPDTFVQMCIQLAYIRLHKKPAPTYETATTRQFRNGRTETLRSCTPELISFCNRMDSTEFSSSEKRQSLLNAISTHNQLMSEAKRGHGCDRHLFGLSSLCQEKGWPLPKLFTDPSFTKSGGNGNFTLSTSTCGYTGMSGGTSPMCLDGYGCFYNFESDKIWLWITAFRDSYETSVQKFHRSLENSFRDVFDLLKNKSSHL